MENKSKKLKIYPFFLGMAFLAFIAYIVIEIINFTSFLNFLPKLLGIVAIFIFLICFIVISLKNGEKKQITIIVGSLFITLYSIFNLLLTLNIISLPHDEFVPNFYNKSISEVDSWKEENNIIVKITYEYSDKIPKYNVISQDINYPTLTKDIQELSIIVSNGPDYDKSIIVPSFIGLKYDYVMNYIKENHLNNVKFEYVYNENDNDTITDQKGSGTMKRSDPIILTVTTNEEFGETEIIDLRGKTLLEAENWLKRHGFKVEIKEDFSDTYEKDYVMDQSVTNETKNPKDDVITLTVSKGKALTLPDLTKMSEQERNKWFQDNDLKVNYHEVYSDDIKLGEIISTNVDNNKPLSQGDTIEITISKGNLKMPILNNVNEFINWATENNVDYDLQYEYSTTIKKDDIIKCSHEKGQAIKENDTVVITISKGKSITLPNLVGMSKSDIENKCKSINLNCSFKNGGYTESTKANISISQSKKAGTTVAEGTSLVITLSAGIIEKVNVPSFVGKTKSEITNQCKNIGITCNFTYASGYSDKEKDTCLSQSTTGKVNKGSKITITLSNGPAKTYTVIVDANQLSSGNPEATKKTLETKLKNACPGVNFTFKMQKANSGIGYLAPTSDVKVGQNKLTQGKTYTVIINSN